MKAKGALNSSRTRSGRRNLPFLLLRARETLLQHFRPIFHRFGLTEQQWRIMRLLSDHADLDQRELSVGCQILGPSLTNILAGLEESGLIARQRNPTDQRRVIVVLTMTGREKVWEVAPFVEEQYRELEAMMGAELMDALIVVLDRLLSLPQAKGGAGGGL